MSTAMINPYRDLAPLTAVGGFDADLNPVPRGFMITEDEALTVVTANGNSRTYPSGTFATKQIYPCMFQKIKTSGTSVAEGKIFLAFDITPAV
jgi:hypothetical protein